MLLIIKMIIILRCVVFFIVSTDLRVVWVVDTGEPPATINPNDTEIGQPVPGAIICSFLMFASVFSWKSNEK